jgi:FMN reductase
MSQTKVVALSAGLWKPSKTSSLALAIGAELRDRLDGTLEFVELGAIAAPLGATLSRNHATGDVLWALEQVEQADVLVAASPVFRGSFTGHFKHFFDLVHIHALKGRPVIAAATGGGDKHCLVIELALKPLFGFLQAFVVPTGVYASERDFENGEIVGEGVKARIREATAEVDRLVSVRRYSRAVGLEEEHVDLVVAASF